MKNYSIEEIIKGVRRRNNDIFKYLYKEIYPSVLNYIIQSNGSDDDAKDIFQESLIILYRKACEPGFKLESSVKTYIYAVCKNLWFQKNRSQEVLNEDFSKFQEDEVPYSNDEDMLFDDHEMTDSLKISLLQKYFRKLNRFCQRILQMFYKGKSHKEISEKLRISYDMSRQRKKECMQSLYDLISADPEFRKYYDS